MADEIDEQKDEMLKVNAEIGYSLPLMSMNFVFRRGKTYGIQGRNGSGKTTLLRTLAGELSVLNGVVEFEGDSVEKSLNIGNQLLISGPEFYPDLSIGEHFSLLGRAVGTPIEDNIAQWGLGSLLTEAPSRISSGQQQRSYLALQLSLPAKVLILDEPERHLDASWIELLCSELKRKAFQGAIIIIASHSDQVISACDEVLILEDYAVSAP